MVFFVICVHLDAEYRREQFSVLSIFFSVTLNDLPNCLCSRQPKMSAYDTHITCVGVDVNILQLNLNHDLDHLIKSWLVSNKLTLDATN